MNHSEFASSHLTSTSRQSLPPSPVLTRCHSLPLLTHRLQSLLPLRRAIRKAICNLACGFMDTFNSRCGMKHLNKTQQMTSLFTQGTLPPHTHSHSSASSFSSFHLTVEKAIGFSTTLLFCVSGRSVRGRVLPFLQILSAYKQQTGGEVGQP